MSVNSWLSLRLGWSRVYSFPIPNPFNPRNPRLKIQSLKKSWELHPEFPGMGTEDQKLQTKNQTGRRMKQTRKFKQCLRRSFYVLAIACALFGLPTGQAATITVNNKNDSGPGSLRQALADAHNEDAINFDSSLNGQTITLTSGELVVNKIVSINGPGPNNLAVDANHASRVFHVSEGASAVISGLSIINGSASGLYGGGIYNNHSTLSVINCTLSGNSAASGGGIGNESYQGTATLTVLNSTLSRNSAASGGGIYSEGQLDGSATLEVLNSTL